MSIVTRSLRTDQSYEQVTWKYLSGPYSPSSAYPSFLNAHDFIVPLFVPSLERRFELYTPNSGGSHDNWKPFLHYKRSVTLPYGSAASAATVDLCPYGLAGGDYPNHVATVRSPFWGYESDYGTIDSPLLGLSVLCAPSEVSADGIIPPPPDLEVLLARAQRSILPAVKQELSLINSVIELKDFKTLPRTLSALAALPSGAAVPLREVLREGAGKVSDIYLQGKFNILPLLSDIKGIIRSLRLSEKRINDLISRAGRPQTRHWSCNLAQSEENAYRSDSTGPYALSGFIGQCTTWREVFPLDVKFHVEIEYNFNFTRYQREHARILSLLDGLGVGGYFNPQIVWNAIPWSFVVDWVLGVSQWLGQFTVSAMEPVINIRRALWSVRRSRLIVLTKTVGANSLGYRNTSKCHVASVQESAFRRQPYWPTISSIETSGLSSTEFTLGAALVFARKRLRRK